MLVWNIALPFGLHIGGGSDNQTVRAFNLSDSDRMW